MSARVSYEERQDARFEAIPRLEGKRLTVDLSGELDIATRDTFRQALLSSTSTSEGMVFVDLSRLDFVDAAGLGALVSSRNALRSQGRGLTLINPSALVAKTLTMTGLTDLLGPTGEMQPAQIVDLYPEADPVGSQV